MPDHAEAETGHRDNHERLPHPRVLRQMHRAEDRGGDQPHAGEADAEIGAHLGEEGIQVWSGNFYAVNAIESLGLTKSGGVVRVGLMSYNTADEVDRLAAGIRRAQEMFA